MSKFKVYMEMKGQLPMALAKQKNSILDMVGQQAKQEWSKIARQNLHSSANNYIAGISDPVRRAGTVTITLRGHLPNMLEEGCGPFDMKPGMLKSKKAKMGKKGKYITIPLSLKSTGSRGASPPVMPGPIYNMAMKLQFGQSLTLTKRYEGYGIRSKLSRDIKRWGNYTWKTSPFQGLTKYQRYPGLVPLGLPRERLAVYKTFRRVSKQSDPNSFIHPGFRRRGFIDQVSHRMEDKFPELLDQVANAK